MALPQSQTTELGNIHTATLACISSLEACLLAKSLMKEGWAENRLADMNLWASGVGALARPKASLDSRLRFQPKARLVLYNLLLTLENFIETCRIHAMNGNNEKDVHLNDRGTSVSHMDMPHVAGLESTSSSASWFMELGRDIGMDSDSSNDSQTKDQSADSDEAKLERSMEDVDDLLDQLIMLGLAIRKSGTAARLQKADRTFDPRQNADLRMYLESILFRTTTPRPQDSDYYRSVTSEDRMHKVGALREVTVQQNHLLVANLRRRHRFNYARRHQRDLGQQIAQPSIPAPVLSKLGTGQAQSTIIRNDVHQDLNRPRSTTAGSVAFSGAPEVPKDQGTSETTASAVDGNILNLTVPTSSVMSMSLRTFEYPSPPPISKSMRGFRCPCCYQTLPEMFHEQSRWRKHIAEDLCPYTCPFPDCEKAEVLYISRTSWRNHVLEAHGSGEYWECQACSGVDDNNIFSTPKELAKHNHLMHRSTISEEEIADLQVFCRKMTPPSIMQCPLCLWPQEEEVMPDAMTNLEHIGNCIHEFSLNSLPWATSLYLEDVDSATLCTPQVEEWLTGTVEKLSIEEIRDMDITTFRPLLRQPRSPMQDPVLPREYFADISKDFSQAEQGSETSSDKWSEAISPQVSLSALFNRQKELRGGKSVLPLKGKRVLALAIASALLPYLETPGLKFSLDYSKIQFFEPMEDGELPDITKPFLDLEHIPTTSARDNRLEKDHDASEHAFHPDAGVLALGILLCELHYCLPVGLLAEAKDSSDQKSVNDDLYTCLAKLGDLEDDTDVDYYLATKSCLTCDYYPVGSPMDFEDIRVQRLFYQNVVKRLEAVTFKAWGIGLDNLGSFDSRQNQSCWGPIGREVARLHTSQGASANPSGSISNTVPPSHPSLYSDEPSSAKPPPERQHQGRFNEISKTRLTLFDASHETCSGKESLLSERWMDNLLSSISRFVDTNIDLDQPVRIALLDSGIDMESPFWPNPKVKEARSFINGTEPHEVQDEIGHGTHALGLLLNVATCAEIYVARVARQETLDPNTYDDIAKAINHAVEHWGADIISMSFGIREHHKGMSRAISNALNKRTLLFAAASNDGANHSRSFPARWPGVFCIHSTDGNGNPSSFNPTASETDVNFSLLGESVSSHWPAGVNGHDQSVNVMSGTSVATPIAAGLAASVLSFVRQEDQNVAVEDDRLGPWLKIDSSMDAVLKSMVSRRRGMGYDYITPHVLFDSSSSREFVYARIEHIKKNIYKH